MFCTRCGTQLKDGAAFCGNCGAKAGAPQTVAGPVRQKKILPVVLIAAALVVIVVLASRGPSGIQSGNTVSAFIRPPNPLQNTAWELDLGSMANELGAAFGLSFDASITWTFVFSDTGYTETIQQSSMGLNLGAASGSGTYIISGDTVTLTSDDGAQRVGTLTSNSLTIDDIEFTPIR
ncbi:hypothetical protein FACS1894147_08990 [Spirochaetia bacterium]|nr:hypothetical protein FACS1894147_08990 [Spirochaetia bacterium]